MNWGNSFLEFQLLHFEIDGFIHLSLLTQEFFGVCRTQWRGPPTRCPRGIPFLVSICRIQLWVVYAARFFVYGLLFKHSEPSPPLSLSFTSFGQCKAAL